MQLIKSFDKINAIISKNVNYTNLYREFFMQKKLSELKPGEEGIVKEVESTDELRRRLIDMGITPETKIKIIKFAPMGDPVEITLRSYNLSIRKAEAEKIIVDINV